MLVSSYDSFVQATDQSVDLPRSQRLDIAMYGLVSEVGSVVAAIKKRLLSGSGPVAWDTSNEEIVEELGDVIWYCFSLARLANPIKPINIFAHDISNLKREIGGDGSRAARIRGVLDPSKREEFLAAAESFPKKTRTMHFEHYQKLAFLTARTDDRILTEVCLAVLTQLSAQLFRKKLPAIELELNRALVDRPINDILGEMAWHISALASVFGLKLSEVAQANRDKVSDRWDRSVKTPLHDSKYPEHEQLPRRFEVAFVTIAPGRSRMYFEGKPLGDDLTDNAYDDDGYRFHDIMHLANAAKLGWSPVLRRLMGRKRRSVPITDEVEDGARAQIVEEAVIKTIHTEGERLAVLEGFALGAGPVRLFPNGSSISFQFLKSLRGFVADLEVEKNRYSEWEAAIVEGHEVFHRLRREGQGTVVVDLEARTILFRPGVPTEVSAEIFERNAQHR